MPIVWIILGALAGTQMKDGFDLFSSEDTGTGVPKVVMVGLALFGGWMIWKKVK